jgi:hypothetical protein
MIIRKIFLLLFLMMTSQASALAQTPVSKQTANNFFENCAKLRDERMSVDSQNAFCSCSSVKMMENMNMEELHIMYEQSERGRLVLNKMLIDVYAPCMSIPVQDLVSGNCLSDPKLQALNLKDPSLYELCGCMSMLAGEWYQTRGRELMRELIEQDPFINDPINPIIDSKEFQNSSYEFMTRCMAK